MLPARFLTARYPVDAVILWEPTARYPYQVFYPARAKQSLTSPDEMAWLMQDFDLEDGKSYWLLGPQSPLIVNGQSYVLTPGIWTPTIWRQPLKITLGQVIAQYTLDYALGVLKATKLFRLFSILDIREVKVLPPDQFPPGFSGGMTYWHADRAIIIKDSQFMPAAALPAGIAHECAHVWQSDMGYWRGGTSKAEELAAYMVIQVLHWLYGDGAEVWRAYPGATMDMWEP